MKPYLEEYLIEKFPKLISSEVRRWGIAIGDGWYHLVYHLCKHLQSYIDANRKPQIEVVQIKEKFGGLRFYCDNTDEYTQGIISHAEYLSEWMCEMCGSLEDVGFYRAGWIKTVCKKCATDSYEHFKEKMSFERYWKAREEDPLDENHQPKIQG